MFLSHLLCRLPEALTHCVWGKGSLAAVDTQCLYKHPGLSSPAPLGTWLGVLPILLLWNFRRDGFVGWLLGAWGCWA